MKNSKKGFTLTEVLIVTAIIVILSGAAIAGIAVSIQQAQKRGQDLKNSQGENWESEAVLEVKKTKIELGNEQFYEESADTPTPTGAASSDKETLDDGDDPDPDPKDPDPDPDPKDPDPKDPDPKDPDPKTDPEPDPVVIPAGSPSYGDTGRPTTGTTVYGDNDTSNASKASVSIGQAGDQNNNCQINTTIPYGTKTYVVYVEGAKNSDEFKSYNGTVDNLGNGYYRVTLNWANCAGEQLYSTTCKGATNSYVVEYTTTS